MWAPVMWRPFGYSCHSSSKQGVRIQRPAADGEMAYTLIRHMIACLTGLWLNSIQQTFDVLCILTPLYQSQYELLLAIKQQQPDCWIRK